MATNSVPGADPKNHDKLSIGAWAEHSDGSLILVKGINENDIIVFEIYDFTNPSQPVYYPQAMPQRDFEKTFSYNPKKVGKLNFKWIWHDKSLFPWSRVMRLIETPQPVLANPQDTLSAARRMALSMGEKLGQILDKDHLLEGQGIEVRPAIQQARNIRQRLKDALSALVS